MDTPPKNARQWPVVVVGGGPSGSAASLTLLAKETPFLWLTRARKSQFRVGEHLPPEGSRILAQLKLLKTNMYRDHLCSPGIISHWADVVHVRDYINSPFGSGWNLDRPVFDEQIFATSVERGSQILEVLSIHEATYSRGIWELIVRTVDGMKKIRTANLVDATGKNAVVAQRIGCRQIHYDNLVGLYGCISISTDELISDKRLLIEAVRAGWWYSLLLPHQQIVAVYLTDADLLPSGSRAVQSYWAKRLEESIATRERLPAAGQLTTFRVASAQTRLCVPLTGKNWVTIGDAAMTYDPLSASGITKALRDGWLAGQAVAEALHGNSQRLQEYAEKKQQDFSHYLNQRTTHYQTERRWPDSIFWNRRREKLSI